jgi:ArsR family transcriptional regulator
MTPEALFTALSDATRLRALMLVHAEGEVCVCELTYALEESQPKISRHLALMREAGIVAARREGTWMHYRIDPGLPRWALAVVADTHGHLQALPPYRDDRERLAGMSNRPERVCA